VPDQGKLIIGRSENCNISYSNKYTSSQHAEIIIHENGMIINDLNSTNGTFVNGLRIKYAHLKPGDNIYILGLEIIIGKGFIAVNNPDGKVIYDKEKLRPFIKQQIDAPNEEDDDEDSSLPNLFYRSPRFKRDIEKRVIKIDLPPSLGNLEETPLLLMLGPSITIGMSSLFIGLFTLQNVMLSNGNIRNAMPTLVMSFSMLIGSVLWPILTKRYERKKRIERENLRQTKYKQYINEVRQEIVDECIRQHQILHENHGTIDDCITRIKLRQRNLWERTLDHSDFFKNSPGYWKSTIRGRNQVSGKTIYD
jgi:S-DNA-T family DNA segregation ATPase FtsK/SpoIIIE